MIPLFIIRRYSILLSGIMRKIIKRTFVPGLFALVLVACQPFRPVEIHDLRSANFENNNGNSSAMNLELVVYNPNPFQINIESHHLKVYINQQEIGSSTSIDSCILNSHAEDVIPVHVDMNMRNALAGALFGLGALIKKEDVKVKIQGTVETKAFFFSKSVPVSIEEKLDL